MNITRDDYQTVVPCVRCDDGEIEATFYERPSLWMFAKCDCDTTPYTAAELTRLEEAGKVAMEQHYDRAHRQVTV